MGFLQPVVNKRSKFSTYWYDRFQSLSILTREMFSNKLIKAVCHLFAERRRKYWFALCRKENFQFFISLCEPSLVVFYVGVVITSASIPCWIISSGRRVYGVTSAECTKMIPNNIRNNKQAVMKFSRMHKQLWTGSFSERMLWQTLQSRVFRGHS